MTAAAPGDRGSAEPRIRLAGAAKRFGKTIAVFPTDLEAAPGELLVILGPSGCGKTTTLRMVAGLEEPTQGSVHLDGRDVTAARPGERDVAFVFQTPALYPHLTALENAAFPLRAQGVPAREASRQAAEMLDRLGAGHLSRAYPKALSGGDRQRVGLARTLVRRPRAFLMDEPLGPLGFIDGAQREAARETLKAVHAEAGAATLLVTHDQEEAMGLADRLAVMKDGRILQIDHPRAVYENPASLFVADFVGSPGMNLLPAMRQGDAIKVAGLDLAARLQDGDGPRLAASQAASSNASKCWLGVRPENVMLSDSGAPCRVEHVESLGTHGLLTARLDGGAGLVRAWLPAGVRFREGENVRLNFLPSGCRWFDGAGGEALPWKTLEVACLHTS